MWIYVNHYFPADMQTDLMSVKDTRNPCSLILSVLYGFFVMLFWDNVISVFILSFVHIEWIIFREYYRKILNLSSLYRLSKLEGRISLSLSISFLISLALEFVLVLCNEKNLMAKLLPFIIGSFPISNIYLNYNKYENITKYKISPNVKFE